MGVAASANSVDEAAICCIGFLIAGLLNHTELTYETYQTNREDFTQRVDPLRRRLLCDSVIARAASRS